MEIITVILIKSKAFIYGAITWAVLHYFEWSIWNIKFNLWKFILASVIFGLLAEFSQLVISWDFIGTVWNENREMVLVILLTSCLYLFIPFILNNKRTFIVYALWKFWIKLNQKKDEK